MKTLSHQFIRIVLMAGLVSLLAISTAYANPVHVSWAENLVANITPDKNEYASSPTYIYWAGINGASTYENRTQCSSFVTRLLKQAYNWTDANFSSWFGSTSPTAAVYHDAINAQNGFQLIQNIKNIQSGDLIAIKYFNDPTSTGHSMIVRSAATLRTSSLPNVTGTVQYEIEVIDSSTSGHGTQDTRLMANGAWDTGVGIGKLRLYADYSTGSVVGYTWSVSSNSIYYNQQSNRHLVIGRLAH